jgi:hypothetical protein
MLRPSLCFALALFLTPFIAPAEVLIFKGTSKESYLGEGGGIKFSSRLILLIDRQAGKVVRIQYTVVGGEKKYNSATVTNLHEVAVEGRGKSYTVLSRPPKNCAEDAEPSTSEGVYLTGVTAVLKINDETTTTFPKTVTSAGEGLFYSSQSNQPILGEVGLIASFNQKETAASLEAGEDLDAAKARLIDALELMGYTD